MMRVRRERVYTYVNGWFNRQEEQEWTIAYSRVFIDADYESTYVSYDRNTKEGNPDFQVFRNWEIT